MITRQAVLLGLSRGAVYYLPQPTSAADLALMRRLDEPLIALFKIARPLLPCALFGPQI